jgi:dolichol-phosphate mannosyltransferase
MIACSFGAVANVGVAAYLFGQQARWFSAALAGILVGAVCKYVVTTIYTWGAPGTR